MRLASLLLCLLFPFVCQAQDVPVVPAVRFPAATVPAPQLPPTTPPKLTEDTLYVIEADEPCLVLASPEGLVNVSEEAGPIKIRGRFIDGTGKPETRTYAGKSVFTVEAVATGKVELLVVLHAKSPPEVIRKTVQVQMGQAPRPPPDPVVPDPVDPPEPEPEPEPPPVVNDGDFRVLLLRKSKEALTKEQGKAWESIEVVKYLEAKCVQEADGTKGYRRWNDDVDVKNATPVWRRLYETATADPVPLPKVFIVKGGRILPGFPFPADEAGLLSLLKKHGG